MVVTRAWGKRNGELWSNGCGVSDENVLGMDGSSDCTTISSFLVPMNTHLTMVKMAMFYVKDILPLFF
jgi:hypothetical protein